MLGAEDLLEQIRGAVDHARMFAEVRHCVDHSKQLDDTPGLIKAAEFSSNNRQDVERGQTGVLYRLIGGHVGANLALGDSAVCSRGYGPGKVDRIAHAHRVCVVGSRRWYLWQYQSKLLNPSLDRHLSPSMICGLPIEARAQPTPVNANRAS